MDPISHGLIGISLSVFSNHTLQLNDPVILGCTLGAMLPDLDIIAHLKGRLNYLLKHRGASHSLIILFSMAIGLSTLLYNIFPSASWKVIFLWTLLGTMSHGMMDLLNSFGAELLWPFSRKKITVDMIMLTDPVVLSSFLVATVFSLRIPNLGQLFSTSAIIISILYLGCRHLSRIKIRNRLMTIYHLDTKEQVKVLPAMYHPFAWNFILYQRDFVRVGIVRNHTPSICRVFPKFDKNNPPISNALEGNLAELFNQLTPYYHVVAHRLESDECIVEFLDLRYWTNGDFLYTGNVLLNEKGEISREVFHLLPNEAGVLLSY